MRFGNERPSDYLQTVRLLISGAIRDSVRPPCAVMLDGSDYALRMAAIARVHAYSDGVRWTECVQVAMDGIFLVDRVEPSPINATIMGDVEAIVGPATDEEYLHAYRVHLICAKAEADHYPLMLSSTGAAEVLCESVRVLAAFDDLSDDGLFAVRRSLWGISTPLERYGRLVGRDVKPNGRECALDSMHRHEVEEVARKAAALEVKVAAASGVTMRHPYLDAAISGYVSSLHHSLRYQQGKSFDSRRKVR